MIKALFSILPLFSRKVQYKKYTLCQIKNISLCYVSSNKDEVKNKIRFDDSAFPKKIKRDSIFPENIKFREKNTAPLVRTLQIIKDDIEEFVGTFRNHSLITSKSKAAEKFEKHKKQVFTEHADVVILGGGLAGVACAYQLQELCQTDFRIVVIEKDLSYCDASSRLSVGGIRQQFSLPENLIMSRYGMDFLQLAPQSLMLEDKKPPKFDLNLNGYLCLANEEQISRLLDHQRFLRSCKCHTRILTKEEIKNTYPWINLEGIEAGIFGTQREGWFDPYSLLVALAYKTREYGTHFIEGEVVGSNYENQAKKFNINAEEKNSVRQVKSVAVRLPTGEMRHINAGLFILAGGANSKNLGLHFDIGNGTDIDDMASFPIPVEPRKRFVYCIKSPNGPGLNCPLVVDTDGTYFRREGLDDLYLCSKSPPENEEPSTEDLSVDQSYFDREIKDTIIKRCPSFSNYKMRNSWAGFYDYNTFDQNPLIGLHPLFTNLLLSTGFSGSGAQHVLAAAKGIRDLVEYSEFRTLDLRRFGFERIILDEPLKEDYRY